LAVCNFTLFDAERGINPNSARFDIIDLYIRERIQALSLDPHTRNTEAISTISGSGKDQSVSVS
jgi:hypothetical protein